MACTGQEKITGLSTAKTLTAALVKDSSTVWVQALTQNVRMTLDGTTVPTASVGIRLTAGDPPLVIATVDALQAQFIEETSAAVLEVAYFGSGN